MSPSGCGAEQGQGVGAASEAHHTPGTKTVHPESSRRTRSPQTQLFLCWHPLYELTLPSPWPTLTSVQLGTGHSPSGQAAFGHDSWEHVCQIKIKNDDSGKVLSALRWTDIPESGTSHSSGLLESHICISHVRLRACSRIRLLRRHRVSTVCRPLGQAGTAESPATEKARSQVHIPAAQQHRSLPTCRR